MQPTQNPFLITTVIVIVAILLVITVLVLVVRLLRKQSERAELKSVEPASGLPGPWKKLREEVEMANLAFNRQVFAAARQLFLDHYTGQETPESLTSEYAKEEFLLVVDMDGNPAKPDKALMDQYYETVRRYPAFAKWFRDEPLREGEFAGVPVLLTARWLCHLTGLRHGTVEVFIDPPSMKDHTLVQVRGMDKFEAPGAFDIPCAGHIDGLDTYEESLRKELREELNLTLDDLTGLRLVERYNAFGDEKENGTINNEHRVLYRAQLKPEAAERIRFTDGEVAGLSVFSVPELRELVKKYPERVASGLSDAIGYYEVDNEALRRSDA